MQFAPPTPNGRPRRRRLEAGFTIIEVAMSSFVMAFGIATSIIAMQTGFKAIDLARGTTMASQIIQSEMERLRMLSWTTVNALPASATVDLSTYFTSNAALAAKYALTRRIAADPDRPSDVINIQLVVRWQGYDGRWQQRSFRSMYAKNGLYDYYYTLAQPAP